jgi:hypothetical protein
LFRSLLRGLKAFRVEKIAKNFALLDRLQNFAEFPHGFDVNRTLRIATLNVAVGRIGFERLVAETTGRPALAT